jgi:hypothetical protein
VIRSVHRLPFGVPEGSKAVGLWRLDGIVLEFYKRYKTDVESALAYKGGGGHYERDLLNRLNIPGVNLEACGCPRAEVLFDQVAFGYWLNQNV